MFNARSRSLRLESLESRQVLNGAPISTDILLAAVDSSSGDVQVSGNGFSKALAIQQHPMARTGALVPFATGDFNGDHVTDLLAENSETGDWWLQLNDGKTVYNLPFADTLAGVEVIGTGDFNADGALDVASIHSATNALWISINTGTSLQHQNWGSLPAGMSTDHLFLGDFDGDGRTDVLAGELDTGWKLAANQAGSSFAIQDWGTFPDYGWLTVLTGDFNGDNADDIVTLAPDLTWWFWQGGPGGQRFATNFGHWKMASGWTDIGVGDFNGDGSDDVIGRTPDGKLRVGTSQGNRFDTWIWGSGWIDSADWRNVTVLDLNDDGLPDQLSQAADGTWWYACNTGGSFTNHYWQRAADIDLILEDFFQLAALDVIDAMPADGVDLRGLVVSATLNAQNRIQLSTNQPVKIDGLSFRSVGGSLIPPANGATTVPGSDSFEVLYDGFLGRLETTMDLTVAWDTTGSPDLIATLQIGTLEVPIHVATSLGPAVAPLQAPAAIANQIYFETLPGADFYPTHSLVVDQEDGLENTTSYDDAMLRVTLNDNNRIVLDPVQPLLLTGVELRSVSNSLIPVGGGTTSDPAHPFLDFLSNTPNRIIFSSVEWPLWLTDELVLDVGWRPNSTTSDLIVSYQVEGSTAREDAHVDEPMRFPHPDDSTASNTLTSLGPVRFSQSSS